MFWNFNVSSTKITIRHDIIAASDKLKYLLSEKEIVQGGSEWSVN